MTTSSLWLFGYGSIVWKTEFPVEESVFGYVKGYYRRFWQGSPDHRGVPDAKGRVVTIISEEDMESFKDDDEHFHDSDPVTWGRAYSIPAENIPEVLAQLDHREKAGYERATMDVHCTDGKIRSALVFIATPLNDDFLGPSSIVEMARQIATRSGPSGPNYEYLFNLVKCMNEIGQNDPHLLALHEAVAEIRRA